VNPEGEPHGPPTTHLGYRPVLDGFRGLAILLVVVFNFGWGLRGGYIGVDLFFVLSGFLITSLLLEERGARGRIAFGAFYMRRALRLLPALLFLLLSFSLVSAVLISPEDARENYLASLAALFYVGNWVLGLGHGRNYELMGALAHTWSLSVEEQFYLVWPPIMAIVLSRGGGAKAVGRAAGLGVLIAALWRATLVSSGAHPLRIYAGTDTRADALLMGCLMAALFSLGVLSLGPVRRAAAWTSWGSLLSILVGAVLLPLNDDPAMEMVGFLLVAVLGAVLLSSLVALPEGPVGRIFSWPPLVAMGRVSYGLYLWHVVVAAFLTEERLGVSYPAAQVLRILALGVVVAFSWYAIERPALRLKRRWARVGKVP
jgi:peptidoglycan/LPS O-acetylase OafA/YrhL